MDTLTDLIDIFEDNRYQQQAEREVELMDTYLEKTVDHLRDLASHGGTSLFQPIYADLQLSARESQGYYMLEARKEVEVMRLLSVRPDELVASFCSEVMAISTRTDNDSYNYTIRENTLARRIGSQIERVARYHAVKVLKGGRVSKDPLAALPLIELAKELEIPARTLRRWKNSSFLPSCFDRVPDNESIAVGHLVLEMFYPDVEHLFIRHKRINANGTARYEWTIRSEVVAHMHSEMLELTDKRAPLGFMICAPRDLTDTCYQARGRYVTPCQSPKQTHLNPSQTTLQAANTAQRVSYSVNTDALDVLKTLSQAQQDQLIKTADVPSEANEGETPHQFAYRVRSTEDSNAAKRRSIPNLIDACEEAQQFSGIYFPVYLDFRGRQYTVDYKGLGPQATKTAKALLQFTDGVALGESGLWCLYHELGNAMGFDKDLLDVKVAKAQNLDVTDPYWFLEGEEPLKAYAIYKDIERALSSGNPKTYISNQIVYVDGSCNGVQHLSLMARDVHGAVATNVIGDSSRRNDLYMTVAEAFMTILEDDHSDAAMYWKENELKEMRKRVKRGVMTLPYGVTENGVADQVIKDGFCSTKDPSDVKTKAQASKFKDTLWAAMADSAPKAMELRKWLTASVEELCKAGVAPTWTTASQTEVIYHYRKPTMKQYAHTGMHTYLPVFQLTSGQFDVRKNKNGIVANLIHSYDAAMLQETARRLEEQGVVLMSFVHDSYGCTAGDMSNMNKTLREVAVAMYTESPLEALRDDWERRLGTALPPLPEAGDLDITAIETSPYFFA